MQSQLQPVSVARKM